MSLAALAAAIALAATASSTVNLMVAGKLGAFEDDEGWEGYACAFAKWTSCINSTATRCDDPGSSCRACTSKRGGRNESITCTRADDGQTLFHFPAGGIFPVVEQFTLPPGTAIIGAADPNDASEQARQQTDISAQTWFVVEPAEVFLLAIFPSLADNKCFNNCRAKLKDWGLI